MAQLVEAVRLALSRGAVTEDGGPADPVAGNALSLLDGHAQTMARDFPMALLELCAQDAPDAAMQAREGAGELSLVDDAQVALQVQLGRAQELVARAAEPELARFDSLVSAVQGLASVQPQRNPLRPASYVGALDNVVRATGVPDDVRRIWWPHLCEQLGPLLREEYRRMSAQLRAQGIKPVGYAVGGQSRRGAMDRATTGWAEGSSRAADMLRAPSSRAMSLADRLGHGRDSSFTSDSPHSGHWPTGSSQFHVQSSGTRLAQTAPGALDVPPMPEEMARSVLAQMTDTIARDERLMPVVRRAALRLEPVLQQLVQVDARFFFDDWHPARRLLDAMTERGMVYGAFDPSRQGEFIALIDQIVGDLIAGGVRGAEPFERALHMLDRGWSESLRDALPRMQPVPAVPPPSPLEESAIMSLEPEPERGPEPEPEPEHVPEPEPAVAPPAEAAVVDEPVPVQEQQAQPAESGERPGPDTPLLPMGAWVEVRTNQGAVRLQLTWSSPHQTLFLFTAPDGNTRSMTRRMLDKLLAEGTLKRVSV